MKEKKQKGTTRPFFFINQKKPKGYFAKPQSTTIMQKVPLLVAAHSHSHQVCLKKIVQPSKFPNFPPWRRVVMENETNPTKMKRKANLLSWATLRRPKYQGPKVPLRLFEVRGCHFWELLDHTNKKLDESNLACQLDRGCQLWLAADETLNRGFFFLFIISFWT